MKLKYQMPLGNTDNSFISLNALMMNRLYIFDFLISTEESFNVAVTSHLVILMIIINFQNISANVIYHQ